ncbi:MAG: M23 family metallopeptidase [Termitinemataceae bacterium]|nr:MAG: M23 family metallopeptidase [Termitinemataceae bacterium]
MCHKDLFTTSCFLFLNFVLIACMSAPSRMNKNEASHVSESSILNANELKIDELEIENYFQNNRKHFVYVSDTNPIPGSIETVYFLPKTKDASAAIKDTSFKLSVYDKHDKLIAKTNFFEWNVEEEKNIFAAVFSLPSTVAAGRSTIKIVGDKRFKKNLRINIAQKEFTAEHIPLDPANTSLRTTPDPQKTKEAQILWQILETTGSEVYSEGPFTPPVARNTRRTSFFGDRRVYDYSDGTSATSIHAGIDYGVPRGTQVAACARGKVVLARPRIVTGNSVILEHLPGLYTIYYHLDKITAKENSIVEEGELIGLSGSTGLSTGPHLHWEIRSSTENTDPDIVSSRKILDKDAVLSGLTANQKKH